MNQKKQPTHTLAWEDQETAMLASCHGKPFNPALAPILNIDTAIKCPMCGKYLTLYWNVYAREISEEEAQRKNGVT